MGAKTAQYGILIGEPEARGKSVALTTSRHLLQFAFSALGLSEVTLLLFADNSPARRLYEKLGFEEITPAPPARLKDGQSRNLLQMRLKRPSP
jgi:RimJ/RimL family protein N-acetyltransferase